MNLIADLIDLVLPERCAGCGGAPVLVCDACSMPLRAPARPARTTPWGLPPPWTIATYEGSLRTILAAYKERGRTALAAPLGEALARAVLAGLTPRPSHRGHDPPLLVWVPSSRGAVRRRGHDPLRGLVESALPRLRAAGLPVIAVDALKQRGRVADQAGLTAAQRTANLTGALEVASREVTGRQVMLVDDVVTTGASLSEAARALRTAGADPVGAATLATTPRHHP